MAGKIKTALQKSVDAIFSRGFHRQPSAAFGNYVPPKNKGPPFNGHFVCSQSAATCIGLIFKIVLRFKFR